MANTISLVCLDVDNPYRSDALKTAALACFSASDGKGKCFLSETPRGCHLYYSVPERIDKYWINHRRRCVVNLGINVEWLSNGCATFSGPGYKLSVLELKQGTGGTDNKKGAPLAPLPLGLRPIKLGKCKDNLPFSDDSEHVLREGRKNDGIFNWASKYFIDARSGGETQELLNLLRLNFCQPPLLNAFQDDGDRIYNECRWKPNESQKVVLPALLETSKGKYEV